ncbi:MAG: ATP phosphoribosyltransferase regulatory subunit [Planctomycetota bacterium]
MARPRSADAAADAPPAKFAALDRVAAACRLAFAHFGFRDVRTPLFEERHVFERTLATYRTDVLVDLATLPRGEVALALRPCVWPGVVRAFVQHGWDKARPLQKLSYVGATVEFPPGSPPRQREVAGAIALGSSSPMLDAELIALAARCVDAIGLTGCQIAVNTLGDSVDQARYQEALRAHFAPHLSGRCESCRATMEAHPSRLLACKAKTCLPSNKSAPDLVASLGEGTRRRLQQMLGFLRAAHVPYDVDSALLRDEGIATHTVFEVRGGDGTVLCCGTRRDQAVPALDGPKVGMIEFSLDVDATLAALVQAKHPAATPSEPEVEAFVVPETEAARQAAFVLTHTLRGAGIATDTDYEDKPLKTLLKQLDKRSVPFLLVVGDAPDAPIVVRARDGGAEVSLPVAEVVEGLRQRLGR